VMDQVGNLDAMDLFILSILEIIAIQTEPFLRYSPSARLAFLSDARR
jgi:hypothetical protein